ncbi:MAG: TetR/AcrR family transcriptional regulator, acrAB operon repressor [Acidobacteriota bacterium]|nr:TetR/AcrR family transcriptional regulator, acrAB operon repressor [Acidobacteriota bacterium]
MKRTKEDAALTRQMVLDAALKVFSRKGFSQATLEEVAREAGLTRGAIYWHFKNKNEMFGAVLEVLYERSRERVIKVLQSGQSPLLKIRQLIGEFLRIISNEDEFRIIEEFHMLEFQKTKEVKELCKQHQEKMTQMRAEIQALIIEGIASGDFDNRLDPTITTWALISYLAGMKTAWLSGIGEISIRENAEKLVDIFINGIVKN